MYSNNVCGVRLLYIIDVVLTYTFLKANNYVKDDCMNHKTKLLIKLG